MHVCHGSDYTLKGFERLEIYDAQALKISNCGIGLSTMLTVIISPCGMRPECVLSLSLREVVVFGVGFRSWGEEVKD
ncbi:hypothetical protein M404DRAFT_1003043 [Pisolithus tinctorius Marx 270]|uniref:Uncharacterized protein n=1 Tax=Pisolithus tinctorius Marx 270 TaxID=870435 RepID=A0A0C3NL11_PISTI|nr:hypothetical protein M404DRAFT_1003043 [Pisolithus tinctorius Marx 270]